MAEKGSKRKRRGLAFVAKIVILAIGAVVAIAIAGDDELRTSLTSKLKGTQ